VKTSTTTILLLTFLSACPDNISNVGPRDNARKCQTNDDCGPNEQCIVKLCVLRQRVLDLGQRDAGDMTNSDMSADASDLPTGPDQDSDGILDWVDNCPKEPNPGQEDRDLDGVGDLCDNCQNAPNYAQVDVDGDEIGDLCDTCRRVPNPEQGPCRDGEDYDNDGVPNGIDLCPSLSNPSQVDSDNDGFGDLCDNCPLISNENQVDRNRNGKGDHCELFDGLGGPDRDKDGWINSLDPCPNLAQPTLQDTDGDGLGDACDPCPWIASELMGCKSGSDSDLDGVLFEDDNCPYLANPQQYDFDENGIGDACSSRSLLTDSDGDLVIDIVDNCPSLENPNQLDDDSNGVGNLCENEDADGDGELNANDNCPWRKNPSQIDSDGDGFGDVCDPCFLVADDRSLNMNEGVACANDFDGDRIEDVLDNCVRVKNATQRDSDGDGIGDLCFHEGQIDRDGDRLENDLCHIWSGDVCEPDADGDGLHDWIDPCVFNANGSTADRDKDSVGDACDNCPDIPNPYQRAILNQDQARCYGDKDQDGVINERDNCPNKNNPFQHDFDNDGFGDSCDLCPLVPDTILEHAGDRSACASDFDGDGIVDAQDNCPEFSNPLQKDTNGNDVGDGCESDSDGDGVPDLIDNCESIPNPLQRMTFKVRTGKGRGDVCWKDSDNDGIHDDLDVCPTLFSKINSGCP